jgi:glucokinase
VTRAALRGGLDLGGTKIQAVITRGGARIVADARRSTPRTGGPEAVVRELVGALRDAASADGIDVDSLAGVGVGVPGSVDPATGVVGQVANIGGWDAPFALGDALADELGARVGIGNDVTVAVDAERRFGAGRGFRSFLGVFWGTGIGAGLVVDGRVLRGRGSAGELGHVCVKVGGRRCSCGMRGCVEAYAGRGALEQLARRASRERPTILFDLMRKRGRDRLTSGVWLRALEARDALARELLVGAVEALGVGIGAAVTLLDVEAVIVGGGLGDRLGLPWLKRIERAARPHTFFREPPTYLPAALGDMGGALGASLLPARSTP